MTLDDRRIERDSEPRQPGILQYGLFITFSRVERSRNKYCWVRGVARTGVLSQPNIWRWDTDGIPANILHDIRGRVDAILTEEIVTRYGIDGDLGY